MDKTGNISNVLVIPPPPVSSPSQGEGEDFGDPLLNPPPPSGRGRI